MLINNKKYLKDIYKKDLFKRYLVVIIGTFLMAIAFNFFCKPNNLVPGGVSGFSIVLYRLFGIDSSLFVLIVNLILLIISYYTLGIEKTKHSVFGSIMFPLFIKLTQNLPLYIDIDTSVMLLSALFAGLLHGFGAGLTFKSGFSVGGTDIISQILSKYLHISIGNAMYFSDGIVILLSGIVFGINQVLYALIVLYIISYITDRVILGISNSKAFYIITNKDKEIKKYIIEELKHNVTEIKAEGGFSKDKKLVLMCVLPTKEYYIFKEGINKIDPEAFFVVTDAYEVVGGA